MRLSTAVLAGVYFGTVSSAFAAGFGVHEFSAEAMGTAYAGSAAATGASFLPYNPASSSGVTGMDFSVTATAILPTSSASYSTALTSANTPAGGNAHPKDFVAGAVIPTLDGRLRLTDRLTAGLAINAPWDLATHYQSDFAGRYYGEQTKLLTVDITPSLAYEISPGITVAAGPQIEYAKGLLSNAVDVGTIGALYSVPGAVPGAMDATATFTGANWQVGYSLGVLARLSDEFSAGVSYNSAIEHDFRGMLRFTPDAAGLTTALSAATGLFRNTAAGAKVKVPAVVRTGARWQFAPGWQASLEGDWTDWTSFNTLTLTSANPAQPPDVTRANWKPTWMWALGAQYDTGEQWSYRAGVVFDPTPVPDATLSPRIPDGDRTGVNIGASYAATDADTITFAASHLFVARGQVALSPAQTGNALRGALVGTTEAAANMFALQYTRRLN